MADPSFELVRHVSDQDPQIVDRDVLDRGPTLEEWARLPLLQADALLGMTVMAYAYREGVDSAVRPINAEPPYDLPVGSAVGILNEDTLHADILATGRAQDRERSDATLHAEQMAVHELEERGIRTAGRLAKLTMGVTVEPCPTCLDVIDDARSRFNITRVMYGASRHELETLGILRPHDIQAPDLVRAGREAGRFDLEFFAFPSISLRNACLELMLPFARDLDTGEVMFGTSDLRATRFMAFQHRLAELLKPRGDMRLLDEREAILEAFSEVLAH